MSKQREQGGLTIDALTLATMLSEALSSGLWGIVLDREFVSGSSVEESLMELKLMGLFDIRSRGNLVIISINDRAVSNRCLYEQCGTLREEERQRCVSRCFMEIINGVLSRLENIVRRKRI